MSDVMCAPIIAGIVTYNPDIERLAQNLASVSPQVTSVVVFDNGSQNINEIRNLVLEMDAVEVLSNDSNAGIAFALNRLADSARDHGAAWALFLDQDSVMAPNMIDELERCVDVTTAMVTPYIVDRNKMSIEDYRNLSLPPVEYYRHAARKGAITSGSLLNLTALESVGGFDDSLFIDYVDYDLNQRILLAGYRIARANRTFLLHEVGRARKTWLIVPRRTMGGKWTLERFFSFGHDASRCYYKARNRVLFTRKYGRHIGLTNEGAVQIPQQVLLTLLFEKDRFSKLLAFIRGTVDGVRMPLGID